MNKVTLIGRVTKDIELKVGKIEVAKFTLAVNRMKKDEADFINCIAFGKQAQTISEYVKKGDQFAISGRIQTGSYENKEGNKVYTTDVIVETFDFISGGKKKENSDNKNYDDGFNEPVGDDEEIPF